MDDAISPSWQQVAQATMSEAAGGHVILQLSAADLLAGAAGLTAEALVWLEWDRDA